MRNILLVISWLLISLAAVYDGYFAWENRSDLATWEINPLARWAAQAIGLVAVLAFKALVLALGVGIALVGNRRQPRLVWSMTIAVGLPYAVLSLYYWTAPHQQLEARAPRPFIVVVAEPPLRAERAQPVPIRLEPKPPEPSTTTVSNGPGFKAPQWKELRRSN
jgi:hypothetical protein